MAFLILFGVPYIDKGQGTHFTSQNTQCWALEQDFQWNIHLSYWSQATRAIMVMIKLNKLECVSYQSNIMSELS